MKYNRYYARTEGFYNFVYGFIALSLLSILKVHIVDPFFGIQFLTRIPEIIQEFIEVMIVIVLFFIGLELSSPRISQ